MRLAHLALHVLHKAVISQLHDYQLTMDRCYVADRALKRLGTITENLGGATEERKALLRSQPRPSYAQKPIMAALRRKPGCARELARRLKIPYTTTKTALRQLTELGRVRAEGGDKYRVYFLLAGGKRA